MPHGIEYIVRPFQSPGSLGNIVIPGTPARTQEKAHITWGGQGTMPSVQILYPGSEVKTCDEALGEQGRDTEKVRIEQEGKPENYVEVERAIRVRLNKNELVDDQSLGNTMYGEKTLDPRLPSDHFSTPSDPKWQSSWKSGWGTCNVTWNLSN